MKKIIYAVKDRWHPEKNGTRYPEIRSDNPAFHSDAEFFHWVYQHKGSSREIYVVKKIRLDFAIHF